MNEWSSLNISTKVYEIKFYTESRDSKIYSDPAILYTS